MIEFVKTKEDKVKEGTSVKGKESYKDSFIIIILEMRI